MAQENKASYEGNYITRVGEYEDGLDDVLKKRKMDKRRLKVAFSTQLLPTRTCLPRVCSGGKSGRYFVQRSFNRTCVSGLAIRLISLYATVIH